MDSSLGLADRSESYLLATGIFQFVLIFLVLT